MITEVERTIQRRNEDRPFGSLRQLATDFAVDFDDLRANAGEYAEIAVEELERPENRDRLKAYLREREDFANEGQDPDFARDYISRGWDYVSLDWRQSWLLGDWEPDDGGLVSELNLKYFLDDGLLQGEPEEYNDWERDGVNRRKEYDGISLLTKYEFRGSQCAGGKSEDTETSTLCLRKIAWRQTTGYDGIFDNNTTRLELTVSLFDIPFILWGQTGYNSDLVDYYRDVNSWGVALELQSYAGF